MADVIVLVDDLFFEAKLRETARQVGITLEIAPTGKQFLAIAAANPAALAIVDLNAREGALDAVEKIHELNGQLNGRLNGASNTRPLAREDAAGNPRRMIAFLSHVQTELAERARAAGCQEVMPRSKFTQNLAAILRGGKS